MFSQGLLLMFAFTLSVTNGLQTRWRVLIFTSDTEWSGTNTKVTIKITGSEGTSQVAALDNDADNFERNTVDEFFVKTEDIGTPRQVTVASDSTGSGPAWHLDKIVLERTDKEGIQYNFGCYCWLSKTEDDGKLERTLQLTPSQWELRVYTSDIESAGTNARTVSVQLFGEKSHSHPIQLDNEDDNFERGQTDLFRFWTVDVGFPTIMRVTAEDDKKRPRWHLDKMVLKNMNGAATYTFECNCWIDMTSGSAFKDLNWT